MDEGAAGIRGLWSLLCIVVLAGTAAAHNGQLALAVPVTGISVDGDLTDWPAGVPRYPIARVEFGVPPLDPADLEAWLQVGYDAKAGGLYLGIEVRDQSLIMPPPRQGSWDNQDACEVFLDLGHGQPASRPVQFTSYGQRGALNGGAAGSPTAGVYASRPYPGGMRYEWRLSIDPAMLVPGQVLGLDVAINDKDADGSFTWMAWGWGVQKMIWADRRGDVLLVPPGARLGDLSGTVRTPAADQGLAGLRIRVASPERPDRWFRVLTDSVGAFRLSLPQGTYLVGMGSDRAPEIKELVTISAGTATAVTLTAPEDRGRSASAGPGRQIPATAGGRRGLWESYRATDGLTGGSATCLVQDRQGALWIGTPAGLTRFDGRFFTTFTTTDGLPDNTITALAEDSSGVLWVGTPKGLVRYDGATFTTYTAADGLVDDTISSLQVVGDLLWIGTAGGLVRYDGRHFRNYLRGPGQASLAATALAADQSGGVWLGSAAGLHHLADDALCRVTATARSTGEQISTLLVDHAGTLWVAGERGVARYTGAWTIPVLTVQTQVQDGIISMLEDRDGQIWLGTSNVGLRCWLPPARRQAHPADSLLTISQADGLTSNHVGALLQSRTGMLWIGTSGGLGRYYGELVTRLGVADGLPDNAVTALAEAPDGVIWIGGRTGLSRLAPRGWRRFGAADGLASDQVTRLLVDGRDSVWVGTAGGLSHYDGQRFTTYTTADGLGQGAVNALLRDRQGALWVATAFGGASRFDGRAFIGYTVADGLASNQITSLAEDPAGNLWFGSADLGLTRFDGHRFTTYTTAEGLPSNVVYALGVDQAGYLWVGTEAGAARFDGRSFTVYTTLDGLAHNAVHCLQRGVEGRLWLGTVGGVSQFDGEVFQSLLDRDGLTSSEISALLVTSSGELWIGTLGDGAMRYRPGRTPPPVRITEVVADRQYGPVSYLAIPSSQSHVAFAFEGVSLKTRSEAMRYRYRLRGWDEGWRITAHDRVVYQDLPRGAYTFEVQAIDRDLDRSLEPARVAVQVHLPYVHLGLWGGLALSVALLPWLVLQIAGRRRANAALRESEDKLRKLTSSARDAIVMMDPAGRVSFWNEAAERIFGYTAAEILGQSLHDILAPANYLPAFRQAFSAFQESGAGAAIDQTVELAGRRQDGSEFPLELSLSAVHLQGAWHAIGIVRDITRRKEAEGEMLTARQKAEEATLAKSRFLANMSHEIRTPMNAILGFSELLVGTELTPTQREYTTSVRSASHALLGLINDILDFSKIEAGRLELQPQPFLLAEVMDQVADLFREKVAASGIELVVDLAPGVPESLQGDPLRLRQVLVNLVGNALKFTEKGEVVLSVAPESSGPDRALLRFAVRDTGIGIPRDKLDDLFSAFTQVDPSATRRFGGTGLGLAVSKQLVELMGGRIGVESIPGQGSCFWFTAAFGLASLAPEREPGDGRLAGVHALVIEDNAASRQVVEHLLVARGMRVQSVASGEEGLEYLLSSDGRPVDVVLLDWRLPGLDGLEVARRLRADRRLAAIPVVMLTAFGRDDEREQARALGVAAFLTKPASGVVLAATVARALSPERAAEEDRADSAAARRTEPDAALAGARILVAEDNPVNQRLAVILLEQVGCRVDLVADGKAALEAVRTARYDVVLMDVQMPEMDGYEATRRIRLEPSLAGLPVIALTASVMLDDREQCVQAGMDDFLAKPIDRQALRTVLTKWLSAGVHPAAPQGTEAAPVPPTAEAAPPLADLPGIDLNSVLNRVGGSEALLRELLAVFAADQGGAVEEIRAALDAADLPLARRLVHTLKGAAGNLSATRVQAGALAVEDLLKDPGSPAALTAALQALQDALGEVLVGVAHLPEVASVPLPTAQAMPAPGDLDRTRIVQLLGELRSALNQQDPVAVGTCLDGLRPLLAATPAAALVESVAVQAAQFSFTIAAKALDDLDAALVPTLTPDAIPSEDA